MNFTADLVMGWLASYLWPMARVTAMLMTMLVIGSQNVPVMIRAKLGFVITLAMAPMLPPMPEIPLFSLQSWLVVAQQVLIGVAIGFATQLLIQSFVIAGQVLATQSGLGFASLVDPINGGSTPVIGQFYLMLGTLIFFAIDGHLTMLHLVNLSFTTLPVSTSGLDITGLQALFSFMTIMFQMALSVSLASITAMLLVNFSFGVMTRAAPQLNIFSMGFAVSMICGLLVLWVSLGGFMEHFLAHWQQVQALICEIIGTECSGG
ncbi:flagellar biosynthetic protein FliR [Pseudaeromonas sharmana]|uniref:Flagellar biosynthetic protein FliR n=1 Tax=Pseudaeromonas sharmana TaxID=328412 RepID=A0ABV8CK13_9GAMM